MDDADITEAQREAAEEMQERIRANRAAAQTLGPEHCVSCDEAMLPLRRQWGYKRCVECQAACERHAKLYGWQEC